MIFLWIALCVIIILMLATLGIAYYCYRVAFFVDRKKEQKLNEEYDIPPGEVYKPFRETMITWMKERRKMKFEEVTITSFDGLTLHGKYYECEKGAPIELMLHGYRGTSERDLCGGIQRCFALGRNVLIVDQRASGKSEGKVITFGINESRDCMEWVKFIINHYGSDSKIIMTGISMGAATVLMASRFELPRNVVGILADCGYTSPKEIIKIVIKSMKLPPDLAYPFVKLGAKIFGHFDIDEFSPISAMKECKIPVIFIHGEADDYVPCDMSIRNFEACNAPKKLMTVPDAGHGLSYLVDPEGYLDTLIEFAPTYGVPIADNKRFR